jgi:hypothetical protein
MPHSVQNGVSLLEATRWALTQHPQGDQIWENIPSDTVEMLKNPKAYVGDASAKALKIAKVAKSYLVSV